MLFRSGDIPRLDKSNGVNNGCVGIGVNAEGTSSDGGPVLDVLEIGGVPLREPGLLKGVSLVEIGLV